MYIETPLACIVESVYACVGDDQTSICQIVTVCLIVHDRFI